MSQLFIQRKLPRARCNSASVHHRHFMPTFHKLISIFVNHPEPTHGAPRITRHEESDFHPRMSDSLSNTGIPGVMDFALRKDMTWVQRLFITNRSSSSTAKIQNKKV